MKDRLFLDTNVLVYAFDDRDPAKQQRSLQLLEETARAGLAVISTQVLQEFYVVVVNKLERPLPAEQAEQALRRLATLPVVQVDTAMILSAVSRSRAHGISLWDALIVQAATESGCKRLLTEDLQDGRRYDSVLVENPYCN